MKKIRIAELFCGPGGLTVGAKMASGFKHTWLVDKDSDSLQTISRRQIDDFSIKIFDILIFLNIQSARN